MAYILDKKTMHDAHEIEVVERDERNGPPVAFTTYSHITNSALPTEQIDSSHYSHEHHDHAITGRRLSDSEEAADQPVVDIETPLVHETERKVRWSRNQDMGEQRNIRGGNIF